MRDMFFKSNNDWTGLVIRLTMGIVMFPHAAQKMFGWFGGGGFEGTMGYFTGLVGLPWLVGLLVILTEFIGSICLLIGFGTRAWAAAYIILLSGIVFTSHLNHGFFMNWTGSNSGEGLEYFILYIGLGLAAVINGGGKYSADLYLMKK